MPVNPFVRAGVAVVLWFFTAIWTAPVLWMVILSFRTTDEFYKNPYGLPIPMHWEKYASAWFDFGYATYFWNSAIVSIGSTTVLVVIGSMAAFYFARYRFPYKETIYLVIFSSIMLPPQVTILALFQMLAQYGLYDSLIGLGLVYVASH